MNAQYILNNEIIVRTLAMREMKNRHTAEYIKSVVLDIFNMYEINIHQIYTITTDNGSNMVKTMKLLGEDTETEILEELENEIEEQNVTMNESERVATHTNNNNMDDEETIQFAENLLTSVRCAAHTLQLVIFDILKESGTAKKLSEIRFICKKLRTTNILVLLNAMKLKKPMIDCPTRWNSSFDMVERFLEYKNFCSEMEETYSFLKASPTTWLFAEKLVEFLRPLKLFTIRLQGKQLLIGDFFASWLELKLTLEQNESPSNLEIALLRSIKKREKFLLEGHHIVSALFLDPRFKLLLTEEQNAIARVHIFNVGERLIEMKNPAAAVPTNIEEEKEDRIDTTKSTSASVLENFLLEKEMEYSNNSSNLDRNTLSNKLINLRTELNEFNPGRVACNANILQFWINQKNRFPELAEVATVVLAVPATQVSVERNFSILKLILSEKRTNLKEENLECILMCKLNMQ